MGVDSLYHLRSETFPLSHVGRALVDVAKLVLEVLKAGALRRGRGE